MIAGVAELADAQDLKSCGSETPYRFDPGLRHHVGAKFALLRFSFYENLHPFSCPSSSSHDPLGWARTQFFIILFS